jgi:hypothetical protein
MWKKASVMLGILVRDEPDVVPAAWRRNRHARFVCGAMKKLPGTGSSTGLPRSMTIMRLAAARAKPLFVRDDRDGYAVVPQLHHHREHSAHELAIDFELSTAAHRVIQSVLRRCWFPE